MVRGPDASSDKVLGALCLQDEWHVVSDEPECPVGLEDLAPRHMVVRRCHGGQRLVCGP